MTLDKIVDYLNFVIKKERGQWYPVAELMDILHIAQISTFSTFYEPERKTQRIHAALQPFRARFTFLQTDFTGEFLNLPTNYQYATNLAIKVYDNKNQLADLQEVTLYKEDEWVKAVKSQVRKPTAAHPVAMEVEQTPATNDKAAVKKIEFYPGQGYNGVLRYLRMPVKPVYGISLVGPRQTPTYNTATSTQLEWDEPYQKMVMLKALSDLGINLGSADVVQFAEGKMDKALSTANKE